MNIIFSSCGNDSIATIAWAFREGLWDIHVAYSDTKWASPDWHKRVDEVKEWVDRNGGTFHTIDSEGFPDLVRRKKAFPTNGMGFCSYELKIEPAMRWLDDLDPERKATCYVGIMRIESERRKNWPIITESSPNHGGRKLVAPLADKDMPYRDELITGAGFEVLEHRSMECSPCINANIRDIQQLQRRT